MADQAEKLRELMSGAPARERKAAGTKAAGGRAALLVILVLYGIVILFPLLIVVIPTFQTVPESSRGILAFPSHFDFRNYVEAWNQSRFPVALRNSLNPFLLSQSVDRQLHNIHALSRSLERPLASPHRTRLAS